MKKRHGLWWAVDPIYKGILRMENKMRKAGDKIYPEHMAIEEYAEIVDVNVGKVYLRGY